MSNVSNGFRRRLLPIHVKAISYLVVIIYFFVLIFLVPDIQDALRGVFSSSGMLFGFRYNGLLSASFFFIHLFQIYIGTSCIMLLMGFFVAWRLVFFAFIFLFFFGMYFIVNFDLFFLLFYELTSLVMILGLLSIKDKWHAFAE